MLWLVNIIIPGVGLVWRGRLLVGLLAVAVVAAAAVVAGFGWALTVAGENGRQTVSLAAAALLGLAMLWAAACWFVLERGGPQDAAVRNDCARSAQAALLRGEGERALEHAQRVVRDAPRLPGAWQLYAACAAAAGKDRIAQKAQRRYEWLAKQAHLEQGG